MGEGAAKVRQKAVYSGGAACLPPLHKGGYKVNAQSVNSSGARYSGRSIFRGFLLFLAAWSIQNPSLRTPRVNLARHSGSSLFCSRRSDRGLGASRLCQ